MQKVRQLLQQLRETGSVTLDHGDDVILVDAISGTKPQGWCCEMFKPLTEEEITRLAESYKCPFPRALQDFYRLSNGMFLFGRQLRIYGVPLWSADYKQPVALAFADGHRTKKCPKNRLFFASYSVDPEVQLFFETDDTAKVQPVHAAIYGDNTIVKSWDSFEDWFVSEHARLMGMYRDGAYHYLDIAGVLTDFEFDRVF